MYIDKDSWLDTTKVVAKKFIESNYFQEVSLFDSFWQAFSFKVNEALKADASGKLTIDSTGQAITDISFARDSAIDSVSPIVLPTVAAIMQQIQLKKFGKNELEDLITTTAAHFGAKPSLSACLVRSLPVLCNEVMSYEPSASEATVSVAPKPQYRIWANGKSKIVDSIDNYEKNKDKYLFWIDLDAKKHLSPKNNKQILSPQSLELLRYLVENIGNRKTIDDVLADVFDDNTSLTKEHDKSKIEQQITKLQKHSDNQFREFLFSKWFENGLGLNDSFKDQYFLFSRS